MSIFNTRTASLTMRRLPPAILIAAAATLAGTALGEPGIASAEWDVGQYDNCFEDAEFLFMTDTVTGSEFVDLTNSCCRESGGVVTPVGSGGVSSCGAPPAIAASTPAAPPSEAANPDVPAGAPPTKPGPKPSTPKTPFTLAPVAPVG